MTTEAQDSLVAAMLQPEFYPKPPASVSHKETHISHLFFAGELVYKVKKSVRYSFLDYSTVEKRRYFLQEELRLNRRLAPSVYIGVLPIAFDDLGWRLGGWTEPAEYTLVMRRLPDKRMLPFLLDTGQVTAAMMRELAELLARFHADAERVTGIDPDRYPALVQAQWNDNLADLAQAPRQVIDPENCHVIEKFGAEFFLRHCETLKRRAANGWLRDVHGDLHTEHVCFAPEGIQIFDCIEFEPKFRQCDLASEIAFLMMDMDVRGGDSLIAPFLQRYRQMIDDTAADELLPFWQCYRALVRAKVYALRGASGFDIASRYARYASRLAWTPVQPFIVLVSGLTGSGKSTLARELSERTGVPTINSDIVRKMLAGKPGRETVPYKQGIYSAGMTEKTYAKMAEEAEKLILSGRGVILDGTFLIRSQQQKILGLAQKHKIPLLAIHCMVSDDITQERLAQRASVGTDVSDGRWEVYVQQKDVFEALDDIPAAARLELDTDATLDTLAVACEKFLRTRLARHW
jgi:aminoglycoside phosphotransferase family enzyme/predicted kinase